jgi:probable phosphoglycerate mutase
VPSGPRIWLVRHGQSAWNALGRWQGHADPPLSETGLGQAERVGERLAGLRPAAIYSSDLRRCAQTAAPLARRTGAELVLRTDLREVDIGRWSGLTTTQIQERFPDEWDRWRAGEDIRRGGGESFTELAKRVTTALDDIAAAHTVEGRPAEVVVVSHGGAIRALMTTALGLDPGRDEHLGGPSNASLTVLRSIPAGYRLERFNDSGHL